MSCRNGDRDVKTWARKEKTGEKRGDTKKKKKTLSALAATKQPPQSITQSPFSTFSGNSDHSCTHYMPFNEVITVFCPSVGRN